MVRVPEDAVLAPCKFLDTIAKGYHIRLYPSTLPHTAQIQYLQEMIKKIETGDRSLVVTNIRRWDNTVRDFVSVRRLQDEEADEISSITLGEL